MSSKWSKGAGGPAGDECYNLIAHALRGEGFDASGDGTGRGTPLVAHGSHWDSPANAHPTLNQSHNTGGIGASNQEVFSQRGCGVVPYDLFQITAPVNRQNRRDGGGNNKQEVAYPLDLRNGGRDPEKHDAQNRQGCGIGHASDPAPTCDRSFVHGVATAMQVRRLTPRECERLQGFPDDWTLVPYRGKPACDGPRYKAIGNSMATNVVTWIGERIQAYEEKTGIFAASSLDPRGNSGA